MTSRKNIPFIRWMEENLTQDQIDAIIDQARTQDCAAATRRFLADVSMPANSYSESGVKQALQKMIREETRVVSRLEDRTESTTAQAQTQAQALVPAQAKSTAAAALEAKIMSTGSEQERSLPRYGRATTTDIGGGSYAVDMSDIRSADLSQEPGEKHAQLLRMAGYDPEKFRIEGAVRESRWEQARSGEDPIMLEAVRFHAVPRTDVRYEEEIEELAQKFAGMPRPPRTPGSETLVWHVSDLQLGKRSNGGSNSISTPVAHVVDALDQVRRHLIASQGRYGDVLVAMTGDCVEGTASQNGKLQGYQTPITETEQRQALRGLMMETVRQLAPYTSRLVLGVVNGNHDRRSTIIETRPGDGSATECAVAVSEALDYAGTDREHVQVIIPHPDQSWMTYHGTGGSFVLAHGHQWRRGKAREWWASGALHDSDVAEADILLHGHEHEKTQLITGPRTICCAGTIDGGSGWYSDRTGGTWQQPQSDLYSVADGRIIEARTIFTDATTGHRRAA